MKQYAPGAVAVITVPFSETPTSAVIIIRDPDGAEVSHAATIFGNAATLELGPLTTEGTYYGLAVGTSGALGSVTFRFCVVNDGITLPAPVL